MRNKESFAAKNITEVTVQSPVSMSVEELGGDPNRTGTGPSVEALAEYHRARIMWSEGRMQGHIVSIYEGDGDLCLTWRVVPVHRETGEYMNRLTALAKDEETVQSGRAAEEGMKLLAASGREAHGRWI